MAKILILEDDEMLNAGLCYNLQLAEYETESATSVDEAKDKFPSEEWDLLLIDVNLPDGSGLGFSKWVREQSNVPIVFLTGNDLDEDVIKGFDAGADDYITKPFNIKIVVKRIEAILSRMPNDREIEDAYMCGDLLVDFNNMTLMKKGANIELTPTEYKLLNIFVLSKGVVLTREILLEKLWDKDRNFVDDHTLTINISRLKSKIKDEKYSYIKTIYGTGYQWIGEKNE